MNFYDFSNDTLFAFLQNDSAPRSTVEQAATILHERYRNDGSSIARHRMKLIRTTLEMLGKSIAPKPQFAIALPSQKKASQPVVMRPVVSQTQEVEVKTPLEEPVALSYSEQLKRLNRKIHVALGIGTAALLLEIIKVVFNVLH